MRKQKNRKAESGIGLEKIKNSKYPVNPFHPVKKINFR